MTTRRDIILATIDETVFKFFHTDRFMDDLLQANELEEAVGVDVSLEEIGEFFNERVTWHFNNMTADMPYIGPSMMDTLDPDYDPDNG